MTPYVTKWMVWAVLAVLAMAGILAALDS